MNDSMADVYEIQRRREKTTVQRAYAFQGGCSERVLVDSRGRMFAPDIGGWETPARDVRLAPIAGTYATWSDVPFSWVGGCPWWK
jgi:hypothetical protein